MFVYYFYLSHVNQAFYSLPEALEYPPHFTSNGWTGTLLG